MKKDEKATPDPLFPQVPEDPSALSDTELNDLIAEHRDVIARIKAKDVEFTGERSGAEIIAELEAGVEAKLALDALVTERAAELQNFDDDVAALAEKAGVSEVEAEVVAEDKDADKDAEADAEADADADKDADKVDVEVEVETPQAEVTAEVPADEAVEVVAVEEGEPVLAAAEPTPPKPKNYPSRPPAAAPERRPRASATGEDAVPVLVAAGGLDDVRPGKELTRESYAQAVMDTARRRGRVRKHEGGTEERILIASADIEYPEERTLRAGDWEGNARKIEAIGSPFLGAEGQEVITAAGGFCAPFTPFYSLPQFATRKRPVREILPSFKADRGGVTVPTPSTIGDITTAITVIEADEDALGGTFATKSCQPFDCPPFTDVAVGIISHCREYGNLNAIAWPESVAHEQDLTMAAHSRTAEGRLLDRIDSMSIAVNAGQIYGAVSTLINRLTYSRVSIISQLRMDENSRFTVILPFWLGYMLVLDQTNGQFDRFSLTTPAKVASLLSTYGFDVGWHLDEGIAPGADNEVATAQAPGTQNGWPGGTTAVARLFPNGEFLHLDMGTLELGIVRDSTLNSTNDHQFFGETFENVARIGPAEAAHRIEMTICNDGRVAAPETTEITCS